jgi:DNA-binding XRE family transcriptional regulator
MAQMSFIEDDEMVETLSSDRTLRNHSRDKPTIKGSAYQVERALERLGGNLRTARIRRNHTIEDVAEKIRTGRRAVMDAEKGKPSTGVGISN